MTLLQAVIGYLCCSAVIVYAGTKLAIHGDRIGELTGLGKAWIGLILMASITSLPELMTGMSALIFVDAPDLAVGDVFGSCVFNLMILSVLDVFMKKPITSMLRSTHVFAGTFGIILITLTGIGILLSDRIPSVGWISGMTLVIIGVYLAAIWLIYRFENRLPMASGESLPEGHHPYTLRRTLTLYGIHALIVIGAALFLPFFGDHIAEQTNMGKTFTGTLFLAASTSLPELVVAISAVRIGSVDMAVGNLFGSNIFNMFVLGIDDFFYVKGPLFHHIQDGHLISILVVIIMTAVAIVGLLYKAERKWFYLAFDTMIIAVLYVALMIILYFAGG